MLFRSEGYGLTETSPVTNWCLPEEFREHSVGRPVPEVEERIVAPDGRVLPAGQDGEIRIKGPNVMKGYYNLPELTAGVFDEHGFFRTGDMGRFDADGFLYITGRIKEMLIISGENVFPREIEEVLHAHPAVRDVQVIGVPDRKFGEQVMAWVCLRAGAEASADDLKAFCRERLAYFKVPHYWKFVDAFPTTVTGKVQKFRMREISIVELGLEEVARIETA